VSEANLSKLNVTFLISEIVVVNSVNGKKKKKKRKLEKVQSISDSPICVTIDDNGTYTNFLCIASNPSAKFPKSIQFLLHNSMQRH